MSTFYLLPSRPLVGRYLVENLEPLFPGLFRPDTQLSELAEILESVLVYDVVEDHTRVMTADDCRLAFRTSIFKRSSQSRTCRPQKLRHPAAGTREYS